jgi:hypothetical protein
VTTSGTGAGVGTPVSPLVRSQKDVR